MMLLISSCIHASEQWTWSFKKIFSADEINKIGTGNVRTLTKVDVPCFTQCMVSWNAFRPESGHFTLSIQVRHHKDQRWGSWHKMVSWGKNIQSSYFEESDKGVVYHHVRLEVPHHNRADAVRVKIETHEGALFEDFRLLSVALSDFTLFSEEPLNVLTDLPTVHVKGVPVYSQMVLDHPKKEVICSPTSLSMVVGFVEGKDVNPCEFAEKSFDKGLQAYGSWPFNVAHAFERCNGSMLFRVIRSNSFADLHVRLQNQLPVVVSVRGAIKGAPQEYPKGHLLVVVGWDQKSQKILCHDPAWNCLEKVVVAYDAHSFIRAWERSRRLMYVVEPHCMI
jgi:hypothetical protein